MKPRSHILTAAIADKTDIDPAEVHGMSREDILSVFYDSVSYERDGDSWRRAFNPDSYRGLKLTQDLVDAESGEVAAEAGTKLNPRALRKIEEKGLSFIKAEDSRYYW